MNPNEEAGEGLQLERSSEIQWELEPDCECLSGPPTEAAPASPQQPLREARPAPKPERQPKCQRNPARPRPAGTKPRGLDLAAGIVLAVAAAWLALGFRAFQPDPRAPAKAFDLYLADEIVVDLEDDVTEKDWTDLSKKLGINLRFNSIHSQASKLMVAKVAPAQARAVLAALAASNIVEAAEPQYAYKIQAAPNDPEYSKQWHLQAINVEEAWESTRGDGAVVAVIDSGVLFKNTSDCKQGSDFAQTAFADGYDFVNDDDGPCDDNGHGTHVAGTIAESSDNGVMGAGVAPEATILPIKVMDAAGRGNLADIADAVRFAADHGAQVINMSLGGGPQSSIFESACEYAHSKGVTIVCAAGNTGQEPVEYPAAYKCCIAVSAVGPSKDRAPYSTFGDAVTLAAPGGDLSQPDGGVFQNTLAKVGRAGGGRGRNPAQGPFEAFVPLQGTSMASPHVAGVAALLVSLGVRDPEEIRNILTSSVEAKGPAKEYGAGILDAAKAVKAAGGNRLGRWVRYGLLSALVAGVGYRWLQSRRGAVGKSRGRSVHRAAASAEFLTPERKLWLKMATGFILGLFVADLVEGALATGHWANILGHGAILPVILIKYKIVPGPWERARIPFLLGSMAHLLFDLRSGATPLAVDSPRRVTVWILANLIVGAYFALTRLEGSRAAGAAAKRQLQLAEETS